MMSNHAGRQRGYVTVLVIIAVAIVTGLSFAMLQSSRTMVTVERNMNQRGSAKSAAQTGIEHALKQMRLSTWAGPASNYSKALTDNSGFEVQYEYETGLAETDPDYWQMPYRVNVRVTGYSLLNGRTIRYAITAATMLSDVRLNPSKANFAVSPPPRTVTAVDRSFLAALIPSTIEFWNRIDGTTHSIKGFKMWNTIESSYRTSFLNEMKTATWSHVAPVTDRCDVENLSIQSTFADVINILALELFQLPAIPSGSKYTPASATYQIYRGGPTYTIPTFSSDFDSINLVADATNPWAIFRGSASLTIGLNTNLAGTFVMDSTKALTLEKDKIVASRILRKLPDETEFEMPVIMGYLVTVKTDKDIAITGTVISDYSFAHIPEKKNAHCEINGRIYCDLFSLTTFDPTKNTTAEHSPADLADYVSKCKLPDLPYCTITDLAPTNLHWQDTLLPFLIPNSFATDGYQWSVLSMTEVGFE